MKIIIDGLEYSINWMHHNNTGLINQNRYIKSFTECNIYVEDGGFLYGKSVLHHNDKNYNKSVGRKNSFSRAVECVNNRNIRTSLWKAYWSIFKPNKSIIIVKKLK